MQALTKRKHYLTKTSWKWFVTCWSAPLITERSLGLWLILRPPQCSDWRDSLLVRSFSVKISTRSFLLGIFRFIKSSLLCISPLPEHLTLWQHPVCLVTATLQDIPAFLLPFMKCDNGMVRVWNDMLWMSWDSFHIIRLLIPDFWLSKQPWGLSMPKKQWPLNCVLIILSKWLSNTYM